MSEAGPDKAGGLAQAMLCAALEGALNLALKAAPDAEQVLRAQAPAVFSLESTVPALALTVALAESARPLQLSPGLSPDATAHVRLGPGAWQKLLERGLEGAVLSGAVAVRGDRHALEALATALREAPPDFFAPLAALFGDATAGAAQAFGREAFTQGRQRFRESATRLRHAARGPKGLFPAPEEAARFFDEVDDFSLAVERAQARFERLKGPGKA